MCVIAVQIPYMPSNLSMLDTCYQLLIRSRKYIKQITRILPLSYLYGIIEWVRFAQISILIIHF